jgi:hypothetical protein
VSLGTAFAPYAILITLSSPKSDKVWLGVLLGLISCNGYIGARHWSVPWGRPDNSAGIYSRAALRGWAALKTSEVLETSEVFLAARRFLECENSFFAVHEFGPAGSAGVSSFRFRSRSRFRFRFRASFIITLDLHSKWQRHPGAERSGWKPLPQSVNYFLHILKDARFPR